MKSNDVLLKKVSYKNRYVNQYPIWIHQSIRSLNMELTFIATLSVHWHPSTP